jgi:hypothetical protein
VFFTKIYPTFFSKIRVFIVLEQMTGFQVIAAEGQFFQTKSDLYIR